MIYAGSFTLKSATFQVENSKKKLLEFYFFNWYEIQKRTQIQNSFTFENYRVLRWTVHDDFYAFTSYSNLPS